MLPFLSVQFVDINYTYSVTQLPSQSISKTLLSLQTGILYLLGFNIPFIPLSSLVIANQLFVSLIFHILDISHKSNYVVFVLLSGSLHLAWCFQGSPML